MKRVLVVLLALVLGLALIGCSLSAGNQEGVDLPEYTVVDDNDVSIPGTTRVTYWVVVDEQIDDATAEAIAIAASKESKSIDEVTVWIYDNEEGATNGYITDKLYDVVLNKGKVSDVIQNEIYSKE